MKVLGWREWSGRKTCFQTQSRQRMVFTISVTLISFDRKFLVNSQLEHLSIKACISSGHRHIRIQKVAKGQF